MSAPIVLSGQVLGAERVAARLSNAGPRVRERVRTEVQRLGLELLRKVKAEKLTGQVLNVRTGRLRRSINYREILGGDASYQARVGTNVSYGRFWELGFQGAQQVREHIRTIRQSFGRPIFPVQSVVHAHSRNVNQAPRPFLQSSLDEMRAEVRQRLLVAVQGGI